MLLNIGSFHKLFVGHPDGRSHRNRQQSPLNRDFVGYRSTLSLNSRDVADNEEAPIIFSPGKFVAKDVYARQYWIKVQYLADQFWLRWRQEYLQNFQVRTKWCDRQRNLAVGDVVLVKDDDVSRNEWSTGKIVEALKSEDEKVRKVKVMIHKQGQLKTVYRPITQIVLLLPVEEEDTENLDSKDNKSLGEECDVDSES